MKRKPLIFSSMHHEKERKKRSHLLKRKKRTLSPLFISQGGTPTREEGDEHCSREDLEHLFPLPRRDDEKRRKGKKKEKNIRWRENLNYSSFLPDPADTREEQGDMKGSKGERRRNHL